MAEENEQKEQAAEQQFQIQKVYLKDISFESPNTPHVFTEAEKEPEINVQINSSSNGISPNVYEVDLKITVTAKKNKKTAFLVEVTQSGVFTIGGFSKEQLGGMLGAYCPETLFPFAREVVCDLIVKGGFPQLLLAPINFNALYAQQLQQQQAAAKAPETSH